MRSLAPGIKLITSFSRDSWYRFFILLLTFVFYTTYHLSRKPISIVKSQLHRNCSNVVHPADLNITDNDTWCDWAPFDQNNYQNLFGVLDNCFLVAYAIGMFFSGIFGERLPLRYYLSSGMILSGIFTALFGLGFYWQIHSLWYYCIVQALNGLVQTTGWPAVVACVGNWFGKGKRGFIMGIWNSHTSVGNILGSLIAGAYVSSAWGLSFIVPGIIIAAAGVICFLFLVEKPEDVNCTQPQHHESVEQEPLLRNSSSNEEIFSTNTSTAAETVEDHTEAISFCGALRIPGVIEFSLCLLFAKLVSYTFLYWLPLYIANVAHFDPKKAGDLSTLFDVGGIVGGILAGLISDYTGGRATTCCAMLIIAAPMLFLFNKIGQNGLPTTIGMLLWCGALVNGPYALITTAVSADLGTHECLRGNSRALSTVTAIIDGTGSIGAAVGPLLAGLISPTGWNNVFYMLITADVLACLLLSRLVYKEVRGWCGHTTRLRGNGGGGNSSSNEEIFSTNTSTAAETVEDHTEAISFCGALRIPGVIEFSLCLLFAKLVSYTFLYWLPLYIANVAHFDPKKAGDLSTLFDVGGIVGGILAGLISDYTGGRATTCCAMLIIAAPMLFLFNKIGQNGLPTTIGMLLWCGALVNGPYALITTAVSADLGTHECLRGNSRALSTVTAIIDGTGSIGAAVGPLLAGLISPTGWNNVFYMLITADVLACLLLSRLVYKEVRGWCGHTTRLRGFKEI
ncbi:glucose-6-phosphate exchanger SLC37A2-like [Carassius carassius]|uniref:glucose-6-phosphate exchanger SLC37A2-like n=1 Tax=Carassius carassius TaxID=217509 RepID=UPI00286893B4|nr:glucose-6-phosphate exchanger SLC37A2-like [Carassius carassius]